MRRISSMRGMARRRTRRRVVALAALAMGTAVLGACSGGGADDAAFTPVAGSDGAYCVTYRAWKVYELDNGGAFDQPTPAGLREWWKAYLLSEEAMLRQAPPEIQAAVETKVRFIRTRLMPLVEKYEFDLERVRRDGTAADQATIFGAPPAEVHEAQAAQYAFEDRACGAQPSPPAADVVFEADPSSKRFCAALHAFNGELDEVASSAFDPDALQALVTGDRFRELLDHLEAAAPSAITADVQADTDWFRSRWTDVVARYDYDIRRIYVDATPEDLAVFNRTHPDLLEHSSRTTAYEEQVCGG
jgi:hypothetical protein